MQRYRAEKIAKNALKHQGGSKNIKIDSKLLTSVKNARANYREDLKKKEEKRLKDQIAKDAYKKKQEELKAKKEEEEKFDLKMGKLRRKLQELKELKKCINSSIKINMEKLEEEEFLN